LLMVPPPFRDSSGFLYISAKSLFIQNALIDPPSEDAAESAVESCRHLRQAET